jgi:hypothetical protein
VGRACRGALRESTAEHFLPQRFASGSDFQWLTERTVSESLPRSLQQHGTHCFAARSCDSWSSEELPITSSVAFSGSTLYEGTR